MRKHLFNIVMVLLTSIPVVPAESRISVLNPGNDFPAFTQQQIDDLNCLICTDIEKAKVGNLDGIYTYRVYTLCLRDKYEAFIKIPAELRVLSKKRPDFYVENKTYAVSRAKRKGKKKKGIEVLEQMEELGVIPDVSHLSDGGFWDVARYSKKPFLATHSNARGAAPEAARNLTDPMIRTLAERGGVMGLNYCVSFVREGWRPGQPGASLEELIRQIKYIVRVGGEDCLALGSDFDGIEEAPEMENGGGMGMLAEAMESAGISHDLTEKIFWKNADRFFKENL